MASNSATSGETAVYGIIGWPVNHSLSPQIHNAAFAAAGIDATYVPFPVEQGDVATAIDGLLAAGVGGVNVTIPHKETVAALIDELVGDAQVLRTVNTLVRDGDEFVGHTTDGEGLVRSLADEGVNVGGKRVVLVGAGGAARSIAVALTRNEVAELCIVNRTAPRADEIVSIVGDVARRGEADDVSKADIVINATSLGMGSDVLDPDLDKIMEAIRSGQTVCDIVYLPRETAFLKAAAAKDANTVGGIGMLLHQAAIAFELWFDQPAPLDAMRAAADRV